MQTNRLVQTNWMKNWNFIYVLNLFGLTYCIHQMSYFKNVEFTLCTLKSVLRQFVLGRFYSVVYHRICFKYHFCFVVDAFTATSLEGYRTFTKNNINVIKKLIENFSKKNLDYCKSVDWNPIRKITTVTYFLIRG